VQEPPFRFGQVVSDEYFVGRDAEIASLTVDLRTATNVVLISPRRYGKTSLVLRVLRALEQEDVLVAYIDLLRTPSKERFASHLAAAIYHGLLGAGAQALQRATEWFSQLRIRPRITLNEDGTPSFEFAGGAPSVDVDATIEHLLGMRAACSRIASSRTNFNSDMVDHSQIWRVCHLSPSAASRGAPIVRRRVSAERAKRGDASLSRRPRSFWPVDTPPRPYLP